MTDKYVGLDLHMATTSYSVRASEGKIVAEGIVATSGTNLVSLVQDMVVQGERPSVMVRGIVSFSSMARQKSRSY